MPAPYVGAAGAHTEFPAEVTYLNTATYGLPPRAAWAALEAAQADYRAGRGNPAAYDDAVARARTAYAQLVRVPGTSVSVGSQTSGFVGLVAANLTAGSQVLTAAGDFTSVLFPFYAQQPRGVVVREAPLEQLAASVTEQTDLVAVSLVQSADGRVLDLAGLQRACATTGTKILLDVTQAAGWLPVDAGTVDYTVCSGYKWLLAPRGTAYFTVRPELMDTLIPHHASWYAGAEIWSSIYGAPLRLATDARRFDLSPVWHAWVPAAASMELLTAIDRDDLHTYSVGLANRFRAGVGLPPSNSAIVSLADGGGLVEAVARAEIAAAGRAGRLRLAFHLANQPAEVDRAVDVIAPHLTGELASA